MSEYDYGSQMCGDGPSGYNEQLRSHIRDILNKKVILKPTIIRDQSLIERLFKMQQNDHCCDFTIVSDGVEVNTHRCVLAASCQYFEASFRFDAQTSTNGQADEEIGQPSPNRLDLTHLGCRPLVVENVIHSFYTNEVDLQEDKIHELLRIADFLQYTELRDAVEGFMSGSMNLHNAILYYWLVKDFYMNKETNRESITAVAEQMFSDHFHDFFIHEPIATSCTPDMLQCFYNCGAFHQASPLQICMFLMSNLKEAICHECENLTHNSYDVIYSRAISNLTLLVQIFDTEARMCLVYRWFGLVLTYLSSWILKVIPKIVSSNYNRVKLQILIYKTCILMKERCSPTCPIGTNCEMCEDGNIGVAATVFDYLDLFKYFAGKWKNGNDECLSHGDLANEFSAFRHYADSHGMCSNYNQNNDDTCAMSEAGNSGQEKRYVTSETNTDDQTTASAGKYKDKAKTLKDISDLIKEMEASTDGDISFMNSVNCLEDADILYEEEYWGNDKVRDILVLLSPTTEMAAHVNRTDVDDNSLLVTNPKLDLHIYDIHFRVWRFISTTDFPVKAPMLEKNAWRFAFLENCFYMVSLQKKLALEYDLETQTWTTLTCRHPFLPHGDNTPVKSLIPIAVAGRLILLSSSKKVNPSGTFSTCQRFYEMLPDSKSFLHVASVDNDDFELPVTQWVVSGDLLVTVKCSTMMYKQLSCLRAIHCYNARTRQIINHEVSCTLETGIKMMMRGHTLYILDKADWYRSFDLDQGQWAGMTRFRQMEPFPHYMLKQRDTIFPALTRVTCHAGASRWQVTSSEDYNVSHLVELKVASDGSLHVAYHPNSPCIYMTAICAGQMSEAKLHSFPQAKFQSPKRNDGPGRGS